MNKNAQFWLRIGSVAFFLAIIYAAPVVLFPFGLSLFLAILLTPLAKWIQRGAEKAQFAKWKFDFSIVLSFILFLTGLYFIGVLIVVPFVNEFHEFVKALPFMIEETQATVIRLEEQYAFPVMTTEFKELLSKLMQEIGQYTMQLAQFSISAIFSVAGAVIQLVVVPFITFYFIKCGGKFTIIFASFFPEKYRLHLLNLFKEIHFVLYAYIRGQLLLSVLMTITIFLGMWLLNMPYPLVIGLLAGLMEMIPVIGPIIAAIPAVLLGLAQGTTVMIQVLIFYIIVQQLDGHLIMPKLMGSIIKVHPLAIIAGVLIGGRLYGVIGMMISVPAVAVLQVLLKHAWYYDSHKLDARRSIDEKGDSH